MHPSYAPENLETTIPKREEVYAAAQDGSILQSVAVRCDAGHNLIDQTLNLGNGLFDRKGHLLVFGVDIF